MAGIIVVSATALLVLGCSPAHFAVFGVVSTLFGLWDHLRVQLPVRLERALGLVIQTPGLHRVHHSPHRTETDSNFGLVLTFWDRLFGTYRRVGPRGEVGLDTIDLADRQSVRANAARAAPTAGEAVERRRIRRSRAGASADDLTRRWRSLR